MYRCGEIRILYNPPVLRSTNYLFTIKPMDFSQIIPKKNWIEAFALAKLLLENVPAYTKITQKLCGELLHSPTKGKKALEVLRYYKVVGEVTCDLHEPNMELPDIVDEKDEWADVAWIICKNLPWNFNSTKSLLWSMGKQLRTYSAEKNLTIEVFIPIFIKEIQKDEFWKKNLSAENFVRKSSYLYEKFGKWIHKTISGNLSDISHIF